MSIGSLFTSHEQLFASWMMHHVFNNEIHTELRFSQQSAYEVQEAYFTVPEPLDPVKGLPVEDLREKRVIYFTSGADGPFVVVQDCPDKKKIKHAPKKKQVYQIVHGNVVEKVEKLIHPEIAKYGNLWSHSKFKISDKATGYYLVEGWLVVSIPEKKEEKKFAMEHGDEITVTYKFEGAEDPIAARISAYLRRWFAYHREKLWIVFATCLSSAVVLSLSALALGNSDNLYSTLFSKALLIGAIAMKAMVLYTGIKLYKLHDLENTMLGSIHNLGHWVQQIRHFATSYPALSGGAPIAQFFTEQELDRIQSWIDTSITGYVRRFFERTSCLQSSKKT